MKKRIVSIGLTAALVVSMLPVSAMAAEVQPDETEEYAQDAGESTDLDEEMEISGTIEVDMDALADSDELFAEYVDQVFYGDSGIATLADYGPKVLDGLALELYMQLMEQVTEVADGNRISTEFEIDTDDFVWTAEELGVTSPDDVDDAVDDLVQDIIADAYNYLYIDSPYTLYWFDKLEGVAYVDEMDFSLNPDGTVDEAWLDSLDVIICVAEAYQDLDSEDPDTTVNAAKTSAAQKAAANAQDIVAEYASLPTEWDKAVAYKDVICDLVSYDESAVEDPDTPYGDPWQMIYVFDEDPETNVVCEGYAKAFQYLCDIGLEDATSYLAGGALSAGVVGGEHAWNVINLEGCNYLVDVTASDEGMIGQDGGLFLVDDTDAVYVDPAAEYGFELFGTLVAYTYDEYMDVYTDDIKTLGSTYALAITQQPSDLTLPVGYSDATLSVKATTDSGAIAYQWYQKNEDGTGTPIEGATDSTFAIPEGMEVGTTVTYYCTATQTIRHTGGDEDYVVTSDDAVVTIAASVPEAFAVYSEIDNSLSFYVDDTVPAEGDTYNGRVVTTVYEDVDSLDLHRYSGAPWYDIASIIEHVRIDASFADAQPTNLSYWFYGFGQASFTGIENIDTSNVTDMEYMFFSCSDLDKPDVSGWDTSNVESMAGLFGHCSSMKSVDVSNWDTSNVTDMGMLFTECSALVNVDVSGWDTSNVEYMDDLFTDCANLVSLDVTDWDISNVTTLAYTFYGCASLQSLDVSDWDTSNVESLRHTFSSCSALVSLDLSEWDTSNVVDMADTFFNCTYLSDLDLSGWNISNVTTTDRMFMACQTITEMDLSDWDTSSVTNMKEMFGTCTHLTDLDVSGWNTANVRDMEGTFSSCTILESLDLSDWDTGNVVYCDGFATGCALLDWVAIGEDTDIFRKGQPVVDYQIWYDDEVGGNVVSEDYLQDVTEPGQYWTDTEEIYKDILEAAIAAAETLDENDYTPESWAELAEALDNANAVDAEQHVPQDDVDDATIDLIEAFAGLELIQPGGEVDKTDLLNEFVEAMGLDESDYTPESWAPLAEALADAQSVLTDPDATQDDVEAAAEALKTAMDNLEPVTPEEKDGLVKDSDGVWRLYKDNVFQRDYTGFAENDNGKWYVEFGVVTFAKTDILKDKTGAIGTAGDWYYVIDSKVQEGFTGLSNFGNQYGWWYIVKGKVDFTRNSVDKNVNGWWYVVGGKVQFSFTGLANYKNENGWWYIEGGKVNFNHNGVDKNVNGWWYVVDSKVQFDFTGLADYQNDYGWWYIRAGKVDFTYTGRAANKNGSWNVVNGKVRF